MSAALVLLAVALLGSAPRRVTAAQRLATLPGSSQAVRRGDRAERSGRERPSGQGSPAQRPSRVLELGAAAAWLGIVLAVRPDAAGLVIGCAGAVLCVGVVRSIRSRSPGVRADPSGTLPLALDLVAACLRSGAALAVAVRAVTEAPAVRWSASFGRLASVLELGADPADAAAIVASDPDAALFVALASRSATSGMRLADVLTRQAEQLRRDRADRGLRKANRVGAQALIPLGLCFLPAFICLGIVPMVAGLAGQALR